ncbi:hypothetical protein BS78_06G187600 [Paspalum vaginatum]|nr:hypothetical protein BS78_06G187600 [Paspalum vaginatum]
MSGFRGGASPLKAATGSSSMSSGWTGKQLPLVLCPKCGISAIRIQSKTPETFNQVFYKCPNNFKEDSTTCGFIRSEEQYANYIRTLDARDKVEKVRLEAVDESQGFVELKKQVDELKQQFHEVLVELYQLKLRKCEVKPCVVLDKSMLVAICVGVVIGVLVTAMLK